MSLGPRRHWMLSLVPVLGLTALALVYQNCSKVRLTVNNQKILASETVASGLVCANPLDATEYRLESFAIVNLNARLKDGSLRADSDADGLTDIEEQALTNFDPLNRRSSGPVLDRLCVQLLGGQPCTSLNLMCNGLPNVLGLSTCDIQALNLQKDIQHPTAGLDSDKDGMADFVEVLFGLSPNRSDLNEDLDGDSLTNRFEIDRGSNPAQIDDSTDPKDLVKWSNRKLAGAGGCGSEAWAFEASQIPLIEVQAYQDSNNQPNLSHTSEENLILFIYKSLPVQLTASSRAKFFAAIRPASRDKPGEKIELKMEDFQLLGEVLP